MFTCIVCGKSFKDTWEHVTESKTGLLIFKDKPHQDYFNLISRKYFYNQRCFCGGHITQHILGEYSWETTCDICEFLFDED